MRMAWKAMLLTGWKLVPRGSLGESERSTVMACTCSREKFGSQYSEIPDPPAPERPDILMLLRPMAMRPGLR